MGLSCSLETANQMQEAKMINGYNVTAEVNNVTQLPSRDLDPIARVLSMCSTRSKQSQMIKVGKERVRVSEGCKYFFDGLRSCGQKELAHVIAKNYKLLWAAEHFRELLPRHKQTMFCQLIVETIEHNILEYWWSMFIADHPEYK